MVITHTHTHARPMLTHTWHIPTTDEQQSVLTPLAYLLLQMPYVNSTKANDRLRQRKKNRFREVLSARMDLKHQHISTVRAAPSAEPRGPRARGPAVPESGAPGC